MKKLEAEWMLAQRKLDVSSLLLIVRRFMEVSGAAIRAMEFKGRGKPQMSKWNIFCVVEWNEIRYY